MDSSTINELTINFSSSQLWPIVIFDSWLVVYKQIKYPVTLSFNLSVN